MFVGEVLGVCRNGGGSVGVGVCGSVECVGVLGVCDCLMYVRYGSCGSV